ncbi:MAG: hypothetical protein R3C28_26135 [Pirellulaceae bacterium]
MEDARITQMDEQYFLTFAAVSRHGIATALATTHSFEEFFRRGLLFCPENKDVVLFPERLGNQFCSLHRPTTSHPFCCPEIWLASSPDLRFWGMHQPLCRGTADWERGRIGGGSPPIRTDRGWLLIYHGSCRIAEPEQVGIYSAGAMLLDLERPERVIGRSAKPLFGPTMEFEQHGFVPNVVFPSGAVVRDDLLQVFYGAADTSTAVIEVPMNVVLSRL